MKAIETRLILALCLFLFTIFSGIWLSKTGRPLNSGIFTLHKLLALAGTFLIVVSAYQLQKGLEINQLKIIFFVFSALFFLMAFITGALLSFDKTTNEVILIIHKIASFGIIISAGLIIYFFIVKK